MKMLGMLESNNDSSEQKPPDRPFFNLSLFGSPEKLDHMGRDRLIVELTPKEQPLLDKDGLDSEQDCACE